MHLNQIQSFLTVSKTLNFTGAARQLGVPQSTISRQINDLESQLGVRLFYRTKRDVQLTDEGRVFLPYAQEIADAARKGSFAVRQLHEGAAGRLSIAAVPASQSLEQLYLEIPDSVLQLNHTYNLYPVISKSNEEATGEGLELSGSTGAISWEVLSLPSDVHSFRVDEAPIFARGQDGQPILSGHTHGKTVQKDTAEKRGGFPQHHGCSFRQVKEVFQGK